MRPSTWRVLEDDNLLICAAAAKLHESFGSEILALAQASAMTGEPIVRSLEYEFPHQGYSSIVDQFMLGSDILVAPVLEDGTVRRSVQIPPGEWLGDDGVSFVGPININIAAPLERLPWFRRIDSTARAASQQ